MKLNRYIIITLALGLWAAKGRTAEDASDTTLAPYFQIQSENARGDALPLKSTNVEVSIAGVIADVTVTQVYGNAGSDPLEAIYIFPASTRSAVHGLEMVIGERRIEAVVQERNKAAATYQAAKDDGKTASLLEQHRPNVFQMSVANILPGDEIRVTLRYSELLVPTEAMYAFVFPTVVGPRYSKQPQANAGAGWVANPYLAEGTPSPSSFALKVRLDAGMPLQEVSCATHAAKIDYDGKTSANIVLEQADKPGNDRDFILKYRLAEGKVASGLLLHRGEKENFFLAMVQPPKRVMPEQIPPREYVFVLDVSGSMNGFPLDTAKVLMEDLLGSLRPTDTFDIVLFAGDSRVFEPRPVAAVEENVRRAMRFLEQQGGGGGTELLKGLRTAFDLPGGEDVSRSVVVVTDGFVDVETAAFELVRERLGRANLFAFGIGSSVNRFLIEGLARAGRGEPFIVTEPGAAAREAQLFTEYLRSPVLTNVRIEAEGLEIYDVEPQALPDVLAERPVIVMGKWRGEATGSLTVRGLGGGGDFFQTMPVGEAGAMDHAALARLWARERIGMLADFNKVREDDERTREITSLGLTYNLLTEYTSFVAVDEMVRNAGGAMRSVKQPLPLPQGVTALAVGGSVSPAPEPETWMTMAAVGLVIGWTMFRRKWGRCA